jgi:hypothetical protein
VWLLVPVTSSVCFDVDRNLLVGDVVLGVILIIIHRESESSSSSSSSSSEADEDEKNRLVIPSAV